MSRYSPGLILIFEIEISPRTAAVVPPSGLPLAVNQRPWSVLHSHWFPHRELDRKSDLDSHWSPKQRTAQEIRFGQRRWINQDTGLYSVHLLHRFQASGSNSAHLLHRFQASGSSSAHCFHWYVKLSISRGRSLVKLTLSALPVTHHHHLENAVEGEWGGLESLLYLVVDGGSAGGRVL